MTPPGASKGSAFDWYRAHGLTLVLLFLFAMCWGGEVCAGWASFNSDREAEGLERVRFTEYLKLGQPWEATFENWESEFLEMAIFVVLTSVLVHRGSAESRRPGTIEATDADPRDFANSPNAPWPVRRGGWWVWWYERSLGVAFALLFVTAWSLHLYTSWRSEITDALMRGHHPPGFREYVTSSKFWFQSLQNWQSEFLGIASMVWLSVYLRQRGSPESKPVHAAHSDTGR